MSSRSWISLNDFSDSSKLTTNCKILTEDGGIFDVDRSVLAIRSPYINRIITEAMITSSDTILIPNASKDVIDNIINFVKTGNLCINLENITATVGTGELLEMPDVVEMCKQFLISNINNENCISILITFGKQYGDLKEVTSRHLLMHFQNIVFPLSKDYLNLQADDIEAIISNDSLNVKTEEYVFWALMKWVEADPDTRVLSLPRLLRCVRFGLMRPEFCEINIWPNKYLTDSEECQAIVQQASQLFQDMMTHSDDDIQDYLYLEVRQLFCRPRIPNEIIFVIGGCSNESATNVIETFDHKCDRWFRSRSSKFSHCIPRAHHGVLWHMGYIYIIGGTDGVDGFNSVQRFDPVSHIWEERGSMQAKRCYVSVAAVGDHIYAMGGYDGHSRHKSCERYDPMANEWEKIADMKHGRSNGSADSLNGKIYIAGGFSGWKILKSVECYDSATKCWSLIKAAMSSPRSGHEVVAFSDRLYFIGGFDGESRLATVEMYDPRNNSVNECPSMGESRSNFATAVVADCIYAMGGLLGEDEQTPTETVECYDPLKNMWINVTNLTLNRTASAACTVSSIVNAREYTQMGNFPQP